MENKLKMRWFAHAPPPFMCGCVPVWVCAPLVNLFRLFSLLQTHANEIEWKRMTSIQAQTDSLISAVPTICLALSASLFFTSRLFHSSLHTHTHTHTHLSSLRNKRPCCMLHLRPVTRQKHLPQYNAATSGGLLPPTPRSPLVDLLGQFASIR